MLHVYFVTLIIDPSFSCQVSTRLLYIVGSNSACLWSPSEIDIWNRIDDELGEFTWFNEDTCTSGKRSTTPCSKSEIESSVSIVCIAWRLYFPMKWKSVWTKKNYNVTYSCDGMTTNNMHIRQHTQLSIYLSPFRFPMLKEEREMIYW